MHANATFFETDISSWPSILHLVKFINQKGGQIEDCRHKRRNTSSRTVVRSTV
jgi:hypothetical protein